MKEIFKGIRYGTWEENTLLVVGILLNITANYYMLMFIETDWYIRLSISIALQLVFIALQKFIMEFFFGSRGETRAWWAILLYGILLFSIDTWINYEGIVVIVKEWGKLVNDWLLWIIAVMIALAPDVMLWHLKDSAPKRERGQYQGNKQQQIRDNNSQRNQPKT